MELDCKSFHSPYCACHSNPVGGWLVPRFLGYYGLSLVHPRLRWNFSFSSDNPVLALINVMQAHNVLGSCFPAIGFKLKFRDHVWARAIETFLILYVQVRFKNVVVLLQYSDEEKRLVYEGGICHWYFDGFSKACIGSPIRGTIL